MKIIKMMMAAALGVLVSCSSVKSGEEAVAAGSVSIMLLCWASSTVIPCGNGSLISWVVYVSRTT